MLNLIDEEVYFIISDAVINKKFADAFDVSKRVYENGWNFIDFVDGLIEHFRNIMTVLVSSDSKLIEAAEVYKEKYKNYSGTFSEGDVLRILSFLNKLQYEIKNTRNQRLTIEIALTHLIGLERTSTISEIITKINSGAVITSEPQEKKKPNLSISSHEPLQKEEIKETNFVEKEKPIETLNEVTTENVKSLWKLFVDKVHEEKFTLGLMANAQFLSSSDDKILLKLEHPEDEEIIQNHSTYLYQKTKEIFGKKYEFVFDNFSKNINTNSSDYATSKSYTLSGKKPVENEHPLIKSIITELGGREV